MASAPFQIVAFFNDLDGRGWSEKYYTGTNMTKTQADTFVQAYLPARMALSTVSITCSHIRIGSAVGRSPFAYFPGNAGGGQGVLPGPSLPSDVGLLIALFSSARYVNKVFLRGLPENIVALEEKQPETTWDNNFAAFQQMLVDSGMIVIRTVLGTVPDKKQIKTLQANSPKGIRIGIPLTDTLALGDIIRIHNVSIPGYNGLKTVTQVIGSDGTNNIYYLGGANPISDPPVPITAYYTKPTVQFPALDSSTIERVTNRRTGRPFDLPRGRARTLFSLRP